MAGPVENQRTDEQFRTEVRDHAAEEVGVLYYGLGGGGFVLWSILVYLLAATGKEIIRAAIIGSEREKYERAAIQLMALLVGPLTAPAGFVLWRLFDDSPPDAFTFFVLGFLVSGAAMFGHWLWKDTRFPVLLARLVWNAFDFFSEKLTGRPLGTKKGEAVTSESMAVHMRKRRKTMSHAAIEGPE